MNIDGVYITNSKSKEVLGEYRSLKNPTAADLDSLYKTSLRDILSEPELAALYVMLEFFSNQDLSLDMYKKIHIPKRSKFVHRPGAPSYHFDRECSALRSVFENYAIPDVILARGADEEERYRDFFKEHKRLLEERPDVFEIKLNAEFGIKEKIDKVIFDNSGVNKVENFDLEELERKIDALIVDAREFRSKDVVTKKIIDDYGYGSHKRKESSEKGNPLYDWHHNYKGELKYLLKEYFRVKFNPDLKFKGSLLDQLGFKPCKMCTPVDPNTIF